MIGLFVTAAAVAETAPPQSVGIAALGIDIRSLLFQIANFIILLVVLRLFAYPPIVKILEARRQKIAESLRTAEALAHAKEALAKEEAKVLAAARARAEHIVEQATLHGHHLVAQAEEKSVARAQQIIDQANIEIEQDLMAARRELKGEAVHLVVSATEKIIGQKLDSSADEKLIHEALAEAAVGFSKK